MQGNGMVQASTTHGSEEESKQSFCQIKLKERVHLDQGKDRRIILKLRLAIESADGSE
jgi:hypothetical protein